MLFLLRCVGCCSDEQKMLTDMEKADAFESPACFQIVIVCISIHAVRERQVRFRFSGAGFSESVQKSLFPMPPVPAPDLPI